MVFSVYCLLYDDRSVFTPEVMEWKGKYYLCYQAVKSHTVRVKNTIGMACADSPKDCGPRQTAPVLESSEYF